MKAGVGLVLTLFLAISLPVYSQVSVTTSRNDNSRDGQNLSETVLTPGNVNVNSFGKLFSQAVDGYAYAQPLYVPNVVINGTAHNVVFVATEHDTVYAFDADSNTGGNASPLWKTSFINPGHGVTTASSNDVGCDDIVPEIGITGTPVIDIAAGSIFLIAKTKENGKFVQRLHALDITTGKERSGSPVVIKAKVRGAGDGSNNGVLTFNPLRQAQRAGLLLQNGTLFIVWASHCDNQPYHGWLISYDSTTLAQKGVWNTTPNGGLGGVWQGGTGLAADSNSSLYFATGNGSYDHNQNGFDLSDTIVKVGQRTNGALQLMDYFTPYNQDYLAANDMDLGSGGVLLLPDQGAGAPHRHLLVSVGKEGSIYLIDRDHMGRYNTNDNSQIVQDLENAIGGVWATPAWWNNNLYFGGIFDNLRQFSFDPGTGLMSTTSVFESPESFAFPGPVPTISANGANNAILWILQTDDFGAGSSVLRAYDANNVSSEFYNSGQNFNRDNPGGAVKFTVPTVVNGKVYVPAVKQLSVYGLLGQSRTHH